ncbi:hypothetical protein CL618_01415 [archaeon]|nr:hypothetical protein [archaeon]|tara:strand:- start:4570 stop:4887 length:318 start_codon:yes stop_codon:yes gene_type:complete
MGRATDYGRNLAVEINYVFETIPESEREEYIAKFLTEFRDFSFEGRKQGEPVNEGCNWELIDIDEIDVRNPEEYARLKKESIHLMYQKGTAGRVYDSVLEKLLKP